jgi:hypothetical protein
MKIFSKLLLAGAAVAGLTIAAAAPAAAYVACNSEGDCWHTETNVPPPGVRFDYHPDDWYFHQHWDANHHFRDYHEGRGYYRGGVWITL